MDPWSYVVFRTCCPPCVTRRGPSARRLVCDVMCRARHSPPMRRPSHPGISPVRARATGLPPHSCVRSREHRRARGCAPVRWWRRDVERQVLPTGGLCQGKAVRSSRREPILSFVNTLPRCHSTVMALMKSCAAISGFEEPIAGEPCDLLLLRGELVAGLRAALADLLTSRHQLAAGPVSEGLHPGVATQHRQVE